ncbi:MAG TPA: DUF924 family protein [Noviherbaspirillum sp.]
MTLLIAENETPDSIRDFWFGASQDDATVAAEQSSLWWTKHPDTDRRIRERFEPWLQKAAAGELDHWAAMPRGRLALILLTDQFPRNMYRNTPQAFAFDALARRWCMEGLRDGADRQLRPIERVFFYLPLEHAESLEDQERAVSLFRALAEQAGPGFDGYLNYAIRHRDVIARFGRFPHRNRILGRVSTPEEAAFLTEPGSSF